MPETQQPNIVIILIIYSPYLLKDLVELQEYISGTSFYVSYKQFTFFFLLLDRTFYYAPRPLIDQAPWNDATSLPTYTTHTHASDTRIYIHTSNPWESNHSCCILW